MTSDIYVRINDNYPLGYDGLNGAIDPKDRALRGQRGVLIGISESGTYLKVRLESGTEHLFLEEEFDFLELED